jgi:glyoxylase-like metal-dependent hydrolase (beta-lactamase superfamily II)
MIQIADHVFAETGFRGCNPGFVVTTEGVVMIDTPQLPEDALQWRDEIAKHGPVRYLINTEPHADHFTGNYYFEGVVVAHEGTREVILSTPVESLKERIKQKSPESLSLMNGFRGRPPSITLSQRLTLYVGNHTFELINMPGHTPCQVAVYIPEERVVFTSDNIFCRVQAWLHQALPYEWLDSLRQLRQFEADILVPGHGSICDKGYIPEMSAFIQDWIDAVSDAMKRGLTLEQAQSSISFLDRYPMEKGSETMAQEVQRMNVQRLYEALKR